MDSTRLLDQVAQTTTHRDRDDLDTALARLLSDFIGAQHVALYRLVREGDEPRLQRRVRLAAGSEPPATTGAPASLAPGEQPLLAECLQRAQLVHQSLAGGGVRCAFPLDDGSAVVGVLEIESAVPLTPRETGLASGLLGIVRNHIALLDYGERDTLTGLRNRKTFESSFGKLAARAARDACWLGVIDIDHFKTVNDRHGHLFGDEVLLLVSRLIRARLRSDDHLFRFGGEEFVVVFDQADAAAAQATFERLRLAVAEHPFPQIGEVTVSLGYTRVGAQDTPAAAIERADAALYYAKRHGRDQLRCYEALLGEGLLANRRLNADIELF